MRVTNDEDRNGASGPFGQLIRLQTEFQTRLVEETLRYFKHLQGALGPAAPGTVLMPGDGMELTAEGSPGGAARLEIELHNLQRVHSMVTPQVTPLVAETGATWFPETEHPSGSRLLAPDEVATVTLALSVPPELPEGRYRGALLLVGFRDAALPVTVTVGAGRDGTAVARGGSEEGVSAEVPAESPRAGKAAARKTATGKAVGKKRPAGGTARGKKAGGERAKAASPTPKAGAEPGPAERESRPRKKRPGRKAGAPAEGGTPPADEGGS